MKNKTNEKDENHILKNSEINEDKKNICCVDIHKNSNSDIEKINLKEKKFKNNLHKFLWYLLFWLGLVSDSSLDSKGHSHGDGKFQTKKWILIIGLIFTFFAFFHMLDSIINGNDNLVFELIGTIWFQSTLGIIGFILMGIAFIKGSTFSLSKKEIAEDTLVAIATTLAFVYSLFAAIIFWINETKLPLFFYEEIEILTLIYLGRFIEEWLVNKVTNDMNSLETLKPKLAIVLRNNKEIEIDINELKINDIVIIKTGGIIPIDGTVIYGETTVDESSLTGETMPITKSLNSTVFGGTISSTGLIHVKVDKLINDSFISKIIDSVHDAIKTKPYSQRIADKIASILVPSVLAIGLLTFFITGIVFSTTDLIIPGGFNEYEHSGAWIYSLYVMITVFVIACPCSFSMTTPMSVLMASKLSKKEGIIFTSKNIFEITQKIDVICFDKTGTLTEGKFKVINSTIPKAMLPKILGAEKNSNHPLANSIVDFYSDIKPIKVKTKEIAGKGMIIEELSGNINIGSLKFLMEFHKNFKEEDEINKKRKEGSAFIYIFDNKKIYGHIELKDKIKDTSLMALSQLRKMDIDIIMITGDQKDTANNIASQLGINLKNVYSEVDPTQKSQIIKNLQDEGKIVAFVGDGINDIVALTQASLGIAIGEGSDAAIDTADIVLRENDLTLVAYSMWLSRKTLFNIKRGFTIAIIYNLISVPLAATGVLGLTGAGPAIAATSMVFNDSLAMLNAMTLVNKNNKKFNKKIKNKIIKKHF